MSVRITCVKKDGGNHYSHPRRHHRLRVGSNKGTGAKGTSSRSQMIEYLDVEKGEAYVKDRQGNKAYIGTWKSAAGYKYLRTYADQTWTDNLLPLPEC